MTEAKDSRPVKAPQTRDGRGISAVYVEPGDRWDRPSVRVYAKRQRAYYCRPVWRLFRRTPTLRRELRALDACRALGIPVPEIVAYRERHGEAELVLEEVRGGRPLHEALVVDSANRQRILDRTADVIARLHRSGWVHGALYPQHILVGPGPAYDVTLIDLEKSRRNPFKRQRDLERLQRHLAAHLRPGEAEALLSRYRQSRFASEGSDAGT